MICTQCGRPVDPGSVFCTNCGARVEQAPSMAGPVRAARSRPWGLVVVIILTVLGGLVILGIALLLGSTMGLAELIATSSTEFGMRGERVPFWGPLLLTLILLGGVFFYRRAVRDRALVEKYGRGCPDDWIERNLYARHSRAGLGFLLLVDLYLFGLAVGLAVWALCAVWLPVLGNVINGLGHALGYRNFPTRDESHNILPIGIWIAGEELHNNHHADPRSARFRARWFELDIGWIDIRILAALRLARVVYARSLPAREFAARHYGKGAFMGAGALDPAPGPAPAVVREDPPGRPRGARRSSAAR